MHTDNHEQAREGTLLRAIAPAVRGEAAAEHMRMLRPKGEVARPLPEEKKTYIASSLYDWIFFIASPVWALALGYWMSNGLFQHTLSFFDNQYTYAFLFYMTLTQGHLYITLFRTHGNTSVFKHYPLRFTLVPVLLYVGIVTNQWVFVIALVLSIFWDVYHSAMQTFGLGRIYDRLLGNDPELGRRADKLLALTIYIGPVLGGALLLEHIEILSEFDSISHSKGSWTENVCQFLLAVPGAATESADLIRSTVFRITGCVFLLYFIELHRIRKLGYRFPARKFALISINAVACLAAWGYDSFLMGFFIINLFHAVQYFALVWVIEKKTIRKTLGGGEGLIGRAWRLSFFLLVPSTLAMLIWGSDARYIIAVQTVCALMHFWYDGFVWSVRASPKLGVTREIS
jgi:hypothetical protein